MNTDYSITHIFGVLVTNGNTAFTFDANCERTNPHYYEASGWMRWVLFFSEIALRNVIIWRAVKSFLRFASFIETIPLPHETSLTYKKKDWQTGLENWLMLLYICVDSCSESRFLKSNLWFTEPGYCGLDGHIWTYQGLQGQWDALKMTHFMTRMYPAYMTTRTKLSHLREKQKKN